MYLSCARAAASAALQPAGRRNLNSIERDVCRPLATRGLVRGGFSSACSPRAGVRARTGAIPIRDAIACLRIYCGFAQAPVRGVVAGLFDAIIYFTASSAPAQESAQEPLKLAGSQLEPVKWTELAGWRADDHLAAFAAYQTSCRASRKIGRTDHHGEISGALWNVCRNAKGLRPQDADTARAFFLGIGGIPVSEAEKATLTEISSALKLAA